MIASAFIASACSAGSDQLVTDAQIVGDEIPHPLSEIAGDVAEGRRLFSDRETGHCVLCHVVGGLDTPFQGNVGPSLTHIGDRLTPAQLRLRIVDYQIVRPGTLMPSYYRTHDLYQVLDVHTDQPVLNADEVEHLVAYLSTLKADE